MNEFPRIKVDDKEIQGLLQQWVLYPRAFERLIVDLSERLRIRVIGRTPRGYTYKKFAKTKAGRSRQIRNKETGRKRKGSWKPTPLEDSAKGKWSGIWGYGLTKEMELRVPHGMRLEEGTYPGVGKGTYPRHAVIAEGGIYSKMAKGGIVQPIIDDVVEGKSTLSAVFETVINDFAERVGFGG